MNLPNQVGVDDDGDFNPHQIGFVPRLQKTRKGQRRTESKPFDWRKNEVSNQIPETKAHSVLEEIDGGDLQKQEKSGDHSLNSYHSQEVKQTQANHCFPDFPFIKGEAGNESEKNYFPDGSKQTASDLRAFPSPNLCGGSSFIGNQPNQQISQSIRPDSNGYESPRNNVVQNERDRTEKKVAEEQKEETCCRICLETEENDTLGRLIVPCRCTGSMKLIHDECLKTWIVSKGEDVQKASCELCHTLFNMKFTYKLKCYPKVACKEGVVSLFSCICLSLIVVGLVAVIIYFGVNWNMVPDESSSTSASSDSSIMTFKLSMIVICSIISGILMVIILVTFREACFVMEVAKWEILPPNLAKLQTYREDENPEPDRAFRSQGRRTNNLDSVRVDLMQLESPNDRSIRINIAGSGRESGDRSLNPLLNRTDNLNESSLSNSRIVELAPTMRRVSLEDFELKASSSWEKQDNDESKIEDETSVHVIKPEEQKEARFISSRSKQKMDSVEYTEILSRLQFRQTDRNVFVGRNVVLAWKKSSSSSSESQKNKTELRGSLESNALWESRGGITPLYQKIPKEFRESHDSNGGQKIEVLVNGMQKRVLNRNGSSVSNLSRQASSLSNSSKSPYRISNNLAKSSSNNILSNKFSS